MMMNLYLTFVIIKNFRRCLKALGKTTPLQLLDRKILIEFSLSVEYLRCSPIKIHLI